MPVPAIGRGGLVAAHQLAQQLEERQAQRAREGARLAAFRAQHLQLHGLGARAHPRRYRRPMSRAATRGHPAGWRARSAPTRRTRRTRSARDSRPHARSDPSQGRDSCAAHTSAARPARASRYDTDYAAAPVLPSPLSVYS